MDAGFSKVEKKRLLDFAHAAMQAAQPTQAWSATGRFQMALAQGGIAQAALTGGLMIGQKWKEAGAVLTIPYVLAKFMGSDKHARLLIGALKNPDVGAPTIARIANLGRKFKREKDRKTGKARLAPSRGTRF